MRFAAIADVHGNCRALEAVPAFRLREFPKMFPDGKYPPNTLLMVDRLVKEAFLVEVQTIAAV